MRTQAAPLKPAGVVLNLADAEGNSITAMGDIDGTISGTHLRGKIDYEFGLLELQFGDYLDDATLTPEQKAEWWYSAADVGAVQAGKIWRPWPVDPTTLRYNSVSYFYLPLDADIIGLDPVRLPPDGRVPIYRAGSYVVIGHTGVVPAATYAANQTINCARTRLSRVYLVGADGKLITSGYTPDLDAGTIAVTDVTGWVQPVTVKHRIEQMARVADVQVNGTLKLTKQLAHDFPVGSVVSSALMAGDLRARALPVWDQQSWDGVTWLDAVGPSGPASASSAQRIRRAGSQPSSRRDSASRSPTSGTKVPPHCSAASTASRHRSKNTSAPSQKHSRAKAPDPSATHAPSAKSFQLDGSREPSPSSLICRTCGPPAAHGPSSNACTVKRIWRDRV